MPVNNSKNYLQEAAKADICASKSALPIQAAPGRVAVEALLETTTNILKKIMKHILGLSLWLLTFTAPLWANDGKGYKIRVKLDNYAEKELIIGFHLGDKQYVKDTISLGADGYFTFEADTLFPAGMYLLVTKPDNNFIQVVMPADDQDFTLVTDAKDSVLKMKVSGSEDNKAFYDYLKFLGALRPEADSARAQLQRAKGNPKDSIALAEKIDGFDKRVKKYQADMLAKSPNALSTKIIRAAIEPELPADLQGSDKERQMQRYYWYRAHFFDNLDLSDPAMLRTPVIHGKVEQYVTKIAPQHPDSVNIALDEVMSKMKKADETYKYYLIHFLNYYAKSKLVGFDACYVHLALQYYCKGLAPWTKAEDLEKICDNARRLEPILVGKIAPNITVYDRTDKPHALWDVDADYTVVFFWAPDCGHCKKSAPFMVEFAQKFKDKGVKVFAVCTAVTDKDPECWKGVEEKGFSDELFMNMHDPYIRSRYKTLYDIQTTPQIFVLDRKHEILMKKIGAEDLGKIMEQIMQAQEAKKKKGK
jgi:thiol-disulfide isomerase/thioredoxin